ncbi:MULTISPECIES: aspartate aminotransferase family protein [unclassified Minwuia]|jgi:acetylornithine/N-succinyldiaminopimelate aminotransferase|uniref:aspartate aminotransferase family protein n=1 Tax=unclassified Minwuia TaxID=2618799 RepID=UPI00247A5FA8|nr:MULTISPECIES: aspartate aminotransferase family protein [unclassified Minwuia]
MIDVVMPTYARTPVSFERGEGAHLYATDGRRFLDFGSGIAVSLLGHSHPALVKAVQDQAAKLWHVSNLYEVPEQKALAKKLTDNSFADTVFFCNSGAEALEGTIKTARKYHSANGAPERYRIITFEGAFHGRTLATMAAGGQEKILAGFGPKTDGFDQVPFGDLAAARAAIGPETAGILVEPIQGEGGVRVAEHAFLKGLRKLCDDAGILLLMDEVQCGMGRTGKLFAHQWTDITPDVMGVAKGIGGGFPLGAFLATAEAAKGMVAGSHGTTYGGNLMAMAAGNAVADTVLAEGFMEHVQQVANRMKQGLASISDRFPTVFKGVRGTGLMLGLECVMVNGDVVAALREQGLLTVPAGDNVVRILPPLVIGDAEIDEGLGMIETAATALAGKAAAG